VSKLRTRFGVTTKVRTAVRPSPGWVARGPSRSAHNADRSRIEVAPVSRGDTCMDIKSPGLWTGTSSLAADRDVRSSQFDTHMGPGPRSSQLSKCSRRNRAEDIPSCKRLRTGTVGSPSRRACDLVVDIVENVGQKLVRPLRRGNVRGFTPRVSDTVVGSGSCLRSRNRLFTKHRVRVLEYRSRPGPATVALCPFTMLLIVASGWRPRIDESG